MTYGPLHPRTYLLMWYRRDALTALNVTSPPDHWEGLLELLEAHRLAKQAEGSRAQAASAGTEEEGGKEKVTQLPEYGICVTVSPHCGRVGDVLAAIAASVVQTRGSVQGYVFDLDKPAPALELLVNGSGWRYAAGLLRQLLSYNAPDNMTNENGPSAAAMNKGAYAASPSPFCHAVSPYFASGSCMLTLEWDAALPHMARSPALRKPGVLAAAPLPGSRWVLGTAESYDDESQVLTECQHSTCAVSVNHELLYGPYGVYVNGASEPHRPYEVLVNVRGMSPLAEFARLEAEAVAAEAVAAAQALQRRPALLVNRAPYSAFYDSYSVIDFGGGFSLKGTLGALATSPAKWHPRYEGPTSSRVVRPQQESVYFCHHTIELWTPMTLLKGSDGTCCTKCRTRAS